MNDRLLKRLILQEIKKVLKEDFEDAEPDYDDESEEEQDDSLKVAYVTGHDGEGITADEVSPAEFAEASGIQLSDPEMACQKIFDRLSDYGDYEDALVQNATTTGGGKTKFYFGKVNWNGKDMLLAAHSYNELKELQENYESEF